MIGTGDGSGGAITMTANLDPRFCHLISHVSVQIVQGSTADADIRVVVGDSINRLILSEVVVAVATATSSFDIARTWRPPGVILPGAGQVPQVVWTSANVSGDGFHMDLLDYLFDIRVRELTPIAPLLWATQGGS